MSKIIGLGLIHLAAAFLAALMAFGTDLDQLRSRSALSRGAAVVHEILWYPHDTAVRALPQEWLEGGPRVMLGLILGNSLLWGLALFGLWSLFPLLRRTARRSRAVPGSEEAR